MKCYKNTILKKENSSGLFYDNSTEQVIQQHTIKTLTTDFSELSSQVINEFVDKILVHEGDRSSGKRVQRVDIHFNFIGTFDISVPEPTAEELEVERKLDEVRAKRRVYNRLYQAKRKVKDRGLTRVQPENHVDQDTPA